MWELVDAICPGVSSVVAISGVLCCMHGPKGLTGGYVRWVTRGP
jgi:hypothetical protein